MMKETECTLGINAYDQLKDDYRLALALYGCFSHSSCALPPGGKALITYSVFQ
jgi:hypothetical protein